MSGETSSANMGLPIPGVNQTGGPTWASDLNASLTLIDAHNHSAGSGVPITPDGININNDLPLNSNNLITARSLRMTAQSAVLSGPADLGCLSVVGVDLYFNDISGNKIQITQSGGVAGSPGSISNLTSPASAAYVSASSTFVWQSAANTPAIIDGASMILRNLTANSKGLTLAPPSAMGADYTVTLPPLPAGTRILTMDGSGTIGSVYDVDNSTLQVSSNLIQIKDAGVTQAKAAIRSTGTTVSAGGFAKSISSGVQNSNSSSFTVVPNLTVTITTLGNPVWVGLQSDGTTTNPSSYLGCTYVSGTGSPFRSYFQIFRGATKIGEVTVGIGVLDTALGNSEGVYVPPGSLWVIEQPAAGTYTYTVKYATNDGGGGLNANVRGAVLVAYEMK